MLDAVSRRSWLVGRIGLGLILVAIAAAAWGIVPALVDRYGYETVRATSIGQAGGCHIVWQKKVRDWIPGPDHRVGLRNRRGELLVTHGGTRAELSSGSTTSLSIGPRCHVVVAGLTVALIEDAEGVYVLDDAPSELSEVQRSILEDL